MSQYQHEVTNCCCPTVYLSICFILITLINEQHPLKRVIFDEDTALSNSTEVTNLLVDELKISMDTTCGDASWINGKNEIHNRSIHNMVKELFLKVISMTKKLCCAEEI